MINDMFSTDAFVSLEKGLSAAALREQVIANNVANINTPGFKKQDVSFEEEFAKAMEVHQNGQLVLTDPKHINRTSPLSRVGINVSTIGALSMRYDGNNVDIDEEMAKLAENSIRFNAMATLIGNKFSGLKMVINGGR